MGGPVGGDESRSFSQEVPHHLRAVRVARRLVADDLTGLVSPAVLADALAIVAELVGNAVSHARPLPGGVIRLACRVGPAVVQVRVSDGGSEQTPVARAAAPDAVNGRGLQIVAALARAWGVEPEGDGRCVWAEVGER